MKVPALARFNLFNYNSDPAAFDHDLRLVKINLKLCHETSPANQAEFSFSEHISF